MFGGEAKVCNANKEITTPIKVAEDCFKINY
jgi:hypothetical protein